ncbi:SufS family cysteine desulfurase [Solimonas sp. K1W22B-7]|uniref:family 2A encapsulin nanocompartment cargo protein cysteine desulfurase n=1 Tax=Solimonas sp. K1W22B-7 TaxID=2303331 RepID=UPI000E334B64|nr:family 2A encapsulin nanocompartment cargo protein cysteine desulfurase [Solimonas sp. K1W22B-7]AXQ31298.1 SufS family cysteine desulfurase [Solimonas sp. K1W22B-7]
MTTPTPTSDLAASGATGLPDIAALTRLANELFSAAPGGQWPTAPARPAALGTPPLPGVPTLPQGNPLPLATSLPATPPFPVSQPAAAAAAAPPSAITPRVLPTQAQSADLHGFNTTLAPALPHGGGASQGVPEAYAAGIPVVTPLPLPTDGALPGAPVSPPSTPYYFLGEASGWPSSAAPPAAVPTVPDFAVPAGLDAGHRREPAAAAPAAPQYYFTESAQPRARGTPAVPEGRRHFDVQAVRRDFPILQERVNGRPLVWLDNAATTQKPQAVIDRLAYFYAHENSNIHRAAHELAARATDAYEGARNKVARFLGASSPEEIVFVRGATEAINLVAQSWGRQHVREGDEIIVSHLEHHANIVPWQMLAAEKGARLRVIPVDDSGQVRLDEYQKLLSDRTRIVSVTQVSNALGTIVPVQQIVEMGHRAGAKVLIDGAQAVSHLRVNVRALDADFYVFSGHKIFGPTGIGVVYGKRELLEQTQPWQGGGNMIQDVTFEKTVYHGAPARFEAGTGNIADAVGLGAALDYLERLGLENVASYEHDLLEYATSLLLPIPGLRMIGTAKEKTSVMSFVLQGYQTEEVGKALNEEGIAVRSGHHCAQPILRRFGVEATVRPSLAFYNTCEEVELLAKVVQRLVRARS